MAILGAIYGQTAIKKSTGGYSINDNATRNKYYGYTPPKPSVKKAASTYKAPKPAYTTSPTSQATATLTAAATTPAPAAPNFQDLTKQFLEESRGQVNTLYDQQKNTQLQQLKAQREAAIGKVNQQKDLTGKDFYNQRNQADVVNAQNVARLRELMAANGISASGENLTMNAQVNSDRQNSLNALNQQEQGQMNEYANQINEINNPDKENAIVSQIESERTKALLDAQNQAEEKAWRQYTYNNMSASEKAQLEWSKSQFGEDMAWRMYQLQYQGNMQQAQNQATIGATTGFNSTQGGGGTTASGPATFQNHMSQAVKRGVDPSWVPLLSEIVKRESSYNPNAKNPKSTAYGYGQFLSSTRANYEKKTGLSYSDPVNQLIMMAAYVKDRYGSPQNALAFWNKNHWY